MRTFKIYFLGIFQIFEISSINYSHHAGVVHCIPQELFCNNKFVPFDPLHSFAHTLLPTSGNNQSVLYIYAFGFCFQYEWDHMVFLFLCLTYFTWYNALKFHPRYPCRHK